MKRWLYYPPPPPAYRRVSYRRGYKARRRATSLEAPSEREARRRLRAELGVRRLMGELVRDPGPHYDRPRPEDERWAPSQLERQLGRAVRSRRT